MPRTGSIVVEPERAKALDVECLPQYWHPQRFGVAFAPDAFRAELRRLDPDLDCTWAPITNRWLIWQRDPTVQHRLCAGWSLKIVWEGHNHRFLPLDERIFANLYARQLWRYEQAGKGYFDRIMAEIEHDKAIHVKDSKNEAFSRRRELIRSQRITNLGKGNKFALHHDGSIVPSRGELNWRRELSRTQGLS